MIRAVYFSSMGRLALAAIGWCLFPACPSNSATLSDSRSSVYSVSTVIVYNTVVPESRDIALAYAKARGIPDSQLLALTCPDRESISREEYETSIYQPLRSAFIGNGWLGMAQDSAGQEHVVSNRIHIIALIYGMPLRILNSIRKPEGLVDPNTGKPHPPVPIDQRTNAASVDSELCLLTAFQVALKGASKNPYFEADSNFYRARDPSLMLVGRIDGPSPAVAKRLIADAIRVEQSGLWGYAYIDQSQLFKEGDEWLRKGAETLASEGIPVVLDRHRSRFPLNYPDGTCRPLLWVVF